MYDWRKMTPEQRAKTLVDRQLKSRPWHSPPHRFPEGQHSYIITAACYEHAPFLAHSADRLDEFSTFLTNLILEMADKLYAWCVLPNHYHLVLQTTAIEKLLKSLAQTHGRTSYQWNLDEQSLGRKVWCNALEREIRSHAHLWASINYVHHNPVKHHYVERWQDWPWTSARAFLNTVGKPTAEQLWHQYPIHNYGTGWDD